MLQKGDQTHDQAAARQQGRQGRNIAPAERQSQGQEQKQLRTQQKTQSEAHQKRRAERGEDDSCPQQHQPHDQRQLPPPGAKKQGDHCQDTHAENGQPKGQPGLIEKRVLNIKR